VSHDFQLITQVSPALVAAALGAHSGDLQVVAAVDLGPRVAVIAAGKGGEAHGDSGRLVIRYVDYDPAYHRSNAPEVSVGRSSWGAAPRWTLRRDLGETPVLDVEGGGTWQGQTCVWTTLVELDPDAPHEVLTAVTDHSADGGEGDYRATILRDGSGIKLVYSGAIKQTYRLRRAAGQLVAAPGAPIEC
jgi:hypothetical protein